MIRNNFLINFTWKPQNGEMVSDMCLWTGTLSQWFIFSVNEPENWKTKTVFHVTEEEAKEIDTTGYMEVFEVST